MSTAAVSALMAARAFDPDKVRPGDLPPDVVKPSAIKQKTEKDEKKLKTQDWRRGLRRERGNENTLLMKALVKENDEVDFEPGVSAGSFAPLPKRFSIYTP